MTSGHDDTGDAGDGRSASDHADRWDDATDIDRLATDVALEEVGVPDDVIASSGQSSPAIDDHRGRSLLRASALPAVGTTLSRATGLIRVGAFTYALGLTTIADVYNLANTTPNILYELVLGGVLSSTLVPLFVRTLDDADDDTASVVTTVAFSAIVAMTLIGVLAAPWINRLFALPLTGADRAQQLALGDDFLEFSLRTRNQHQLHAARCQHQRAGAAERARCSGDQRDLAAHVE